MSVTDDDILKELGNTERVNKLEEEKTEIIKSDFIKKMKSGLGKEIKKNPNKITIIKKPWYTKVKIFIRNLFTKF